ncbi:DUF3054 domain-containing protein [Gordonia sp. PDNC005]|uniref:DUF3054 domain-containing protein n=1 Tax=unclassified Gordonia (in: high G+C Gram-positive bacteria) TaxID=2657482 RepID=UPI001965174B|nr:DUF3054 domain-containing protein [Gordonia sp. PDNC005]QRY62559.1 DUF3054 domain-containing protein [Gordonia sp. PDNC005]
MSSSASSSRGLVGPLVVAGLCDLIALVVFVAIGRRSHDEAGSVTGFLTTLWPFLIGAAIGWAVAYAFTRSDVFLPSRIVPSGVVIWVSTVIVGMILRVVSGQGTAVSFIVVATIATGVLLVGWRALAAFSEARRSR